MKKPLIFLTVILGLLSGAVTAQNLYVNKADGTRQTYNIKDIQKLFFTDVTVAHPVYDDSTTIVKNLVFEFQTIQEDVYVPLENIRCITFDRIVSIVENKPIPTFSLYPNPVREILHLSDYGEDIKGFRIFDLTGRTVLTNLHLTGTETQINVSELKPGIYVISIFSDKENMTKKFIKN